MELKDKLVVVTGAARGIGEAIARAFGQAGGRVILADLPSSDVETTASRLAGEGYTTHSAHIDVTDRGLLSGTADRIQREHGDIDVLVNNAGVFKTATVDADDSDQVWDRTIAANLSGVFNVTRAFLPQLSRTRGAIVNISSVVAFTSGLSHVSYTASKGGVSALTRSMCREFAPLGIRVNAVAPGWTDTEMVGKGKGGGDDAVVNWHVPFRRYARPEEIAAPVVFLASNRASFISGVTLPVDGGFLTV